MTRPMQRQFAAAPEPRRDEGAPPIPSDVQALVRDVVQGGSSWLHPRVVGPDAVRFSWTAGGASPTTPDDVSLLASHYFVATRLRAFMVAPDTDDEDAQYIRFNIKSTSDKRDMFTSDLGFAELLTLNGPAGDLEFEVPHVFQPGTQIELNPSTATGISGARVVGVVLYGFKVAADPGAVGN